MESAASFHHRGAKEVKLERWRGIASGSRLSGRNRDERTKVAGGSRLSEHVELDARMQPGNGAKKETHEERKTNRSVFAASISPPTISLSLSLSLFVCNTRSFLWALASRVGLRFYIPFRSPRAKRCDCYSISP